MLSVGRMGGGQSRYYLDLASEDYYLDGGEPLGKWWGRGAEKLKLSGTVERRDLERAFAGFSPDGEGLVQNAGKKSHRPGFDLTFSAPKSVSVLWSQADSEMRQKIQQAHHAAVLAALSYFQDEAAFSRRGKGGLERVAAGLLVATFEHGTSRALDPQLHTHALVMNVAFGEDGRTGTLDAQMLYKLKMTLGVIYRADFSARLGELGFECEQKRSWFEIKGIVGAVIDGMSKRRAEIEEKLGPGGLESASAAAFATLETRGKKGIVPPRLELFDRWKKEAAEYGLTADQVSRLCGKAPLQASNINDVFAAATKKIAATQSHFSEHELIRVFAEVAQGTGIYVEAIRSHVKAELERSRSFVFLGERAGERRYTTAENHALEKEMLSGVDRLAAAGRHAVRKPIVESVIRAHGRERSGVVEEIKHHAKQLVRAARRKSTTRIDRDHVRQAAKITLTAEQARAVRGLTCRRTGSIRLLSGVAGAGKTTTLAVAREAFEKAGYSVHGVTLSGKARKELEKGSGIKSDTLAMLDIKMNPSTPYLLKHYARQSVRALRGRRTFLHKPPFRIDKKTVLVVDEAGMLGTRQLARLVKAVEKGGGILILVGDRAQLQPIEVGGPFASLCDRIDHPHLTNVTRQRDPKDIEAAKAVREGRAKDALEHLADTKRLVVEKTKTAAIATLVSEWATKEAKRPEDALIFAGTNADVNEINQLCQGTRRALGLIDPRRRIKINETYVHVGDRVLLTKTDRKLDLANGETATVTHINTLLSRVTVKVDGGARIVIPLRDYKHQYGEKRGQVGVSLGYAVTTHKGQGTTVERAYVLAGGAMQDREISYVQVSRARGETRVYTNDALAASLSTQMNQSRAKDLAHDVTRENQREEQKRAELHRDQERRI